MYEFWRTGVSCNQQLFLACFLPKSLIDYYVITARTSKNCSCAWEKERKNGIVYNNHFVNMPSASKWNTDISFRDAPW